tara:strand:+ start:13915 stop:14205 length:291 start_codon:yes stop_codon:yes gene_type:complete
MSYLIQNRFTYSAVSSNTSLVLNYYYSCTGSITLTLPAVNGSRAGDEIKVKNLGTGTITINRTGSDTIDGATSAALGVQYQMLSFVSNGSNTWEIN